MARGSSPLIKSLVRFLEAQISEHRLQIIVPLESKGALLTDVALERIDGANRPRVCYLRSLEYLPPETLKNEMFGVFDDCAFSGRTLGRALAHMKQLGVPSEHIHLMAFFKFQEVGTSLDELTDVLARTAVPTDSVLLRLSRDEILREVQRLAIANKIPASYDNLEWDVRVSSAEYASLMHDLSRSSSFLYYGGRGSVDASALLLPQAGRRPVSVPPKIRLWYDPSQSLLRLSPLYFSRGERRTKDHSESSLEEILTPPAATQKQRSFAVLQAESLRHQVNLLGFLKPYLRTHGLVAALNKKQLDRYYGSRSDTVSAHIDAAYAEADERELPLDTVGPRRIDFHWIALEIMRRLGLMYWSQRPPRRVSKGMTVAELIDEFKPVASLEAVHAAIDYCADSNLIATFFGWKGNGVFRAFRLTENGEREVGRGDGSRRRSLTFFEKLGALILYKSETKSASWWVLEKVPAILMRRLGYQLPQLEAAVGFFGDVTKLRVGETDGLSLTWPQLRTDMWTVENARVGRSGRRERRFRLNVERFEQVRDEILADPEIVKAIGSVETVLALVSSSKTRGHDIAIMLDILADRCGGATYLAYAAVKAADLIQRRSHLKTRGDREPDTREIADWLSGLQEKTKLLKGSRRQVLLKDAGRVAARLSRQGRGDLAEQLLQSKPFPDGSGIVESFERLCALIKRLDTAAQLAEPATRERLSCDIAEKLNRSEWRREELDDASGVHAASTAIKRWATALSGEAQDQSVYVNARLDVPPGHERRLYVVAYDLIGSSKGLYAGRSGSERDRYVQSIISNWFIAFGGSAQRAEFGGGDLGFGFFDRLETAIHASLWASHHLELLKQTNPTLRQDGPHAGFGIVQDVVRAGFMNQVRSDLLSRFAKAWKREAETIADAAGRDGLPIVAIHADMFSDVQSLPSKWFRRTTQLDGIPVRFVSSDARPAIPWDL